MEKLELTILGCGSAKPTVRHFPASQVLNVRDKLFMIDCGENTQVQFCRSHLKFSRLHSVFISHLHGDHCLGLPGLISTMNLLGRTAQLHVFAPKGAENLLRPFISFFNREMTYELVFHEFDCNQSALIYEDRCISVSTIPLKHRMPCCGFLFKEKPLPSHILRDMIDAYEIPLSQINLIKNGADYVTPAGDVIPNHRLTTPAAPARSYAYCSDTIYLPQLKEILKGVNLLYHEATFADGEAARAAQTFHSTAAQAGQLAADAGVEKLVIGHFSARYDNEEHLLEQARGRFSNTVLARENLKIIIGAD